ncbi:MAG: SF1B family DNA helicase RecD2 [bacterium]
MMRTINAVVLDIIYVSSNQEFSVVKAESTRGEKITAVGNFYIPRTGMIYDFTGEWEMDPRYGLRFKVEQALPSEIITLDNIVNFLAHCKLKGVGPACARKIVDKFKDSTLDVLDHHPEKLLEIPGIGPVTYEKIKESWKEHKNLRMVLLYLAKLNISHSLSLKLIKILGEKRVIPIIEQNPYLLIDLVEGIGFKKADIIAQQRGIETDSAYRIRAGLKYTLQQATQQGQVCLPYSPLIKQSSLLLNVDSAKVEATAAGLINSGTLIKELQDNQDYVYLSYFHTIETEVARMILFLISSPAKRFYFNTPVHRSLHQQQVVENIGRSRISAVTGGPGTGKTTLIRHIYQSLRGKLLLAAPTGRAAKRLEEATGCTAKTIHRLLEYNPILNEFKINANQPIENSLIVIDESSMIDLPLAYQLIQAVGPGSSLVLVGDVNQLPSVGPGSFFQDVLSCSEIPRVVLTKIYRQKVGSDIIYASHRILQGKKPFFAKNPQGDIFFIEQSDPEKISSLLYKLIQERIPAYLGEIPEIFDVQIITPVNRGPLGTAQLNSILADQINPVAVSRPAVGDKVIQMKNNYNLEVFNGDIGKVVDREKNQLNVDFNGRIVEYRGEDIDTLSLAYAITVHKSQGSEYPVVIIILHTQHYPMLKRSLLYTAVTRGKKLVVLIGCRKAFYLALSNNAPLQRYSRLSYRLNKVNFDDITSD